MIAMANVQYDPNLLLVDRDGPRATAGLGYGSTAEYLRW
jgi:hypothetical protein